MLTSIDQQLIGTDRRTSRAFSDATWTFDAINSITTVRNMRNPSENLKYNSDNGEAENLGEKETENTNPMVSGRGLEMLKLTTMARYYWNELNI